MMIQDTFGNFSNEFVQESVLAEAIASQNNSTIEATLPPLENSTQALLEKASKLTGEQTTKAVLAVKSIMSALGLKDDARLLTPEIATNILAWVGVATALMKVKKNWMHVTAGLVALYYYNNIYKKGGTMEDMQKKIIDRAMF